MKKDLETMYHDTAMLLRKYREVTWALEVEGRRASQELCQKTHHVDTFLDAAILAGADISGTKLEGRAQSMDRSRKMIDLINGALEMLRTEHPKGTLYYEILYLSYIDRQKYTQDEILMLLEEKDIQISLRTMRSYLKEAVGIIGEILWGFDDRESVELLKKYAGTNISKLGRYDHAGHYHYKTDSD